MTTTKATTKPRVAAKAKAPLPTRLVAGCMTGTSLDGLDVALLRLTGTGLDMTAELLATESLSLGKLAEPLRALADQKPQPIGEIARLAADLSRLHIRALEKLGRGHRFDLVCVHGQTVFHAPPLSVQLINAAVLCQAIKVPIVYDLRAADLAHGGQGAPITPLADLVLYADPKERRTVVNLGGYCNITRLGAGRDPAAVTGGDVCACNQVLDGVARTVFNQPFDPEGRNAMKGKTDAPALRDLETRLQRQVRARKSLGTGDELTGWIAHHRSRVAADDLARTACAAIARTIVKAATPSDRLVLAGGGAKNKALVAELASAAGVPAVLSDDLGIPGTHREAAGFAVLGALCQDRVPITLSAVTGVATPPVAGCWTYP